ncbi:MULTISPECIES: DNA repair protein RadA [unclassified Neochlamydia]|uniref:DNA repair protein RadA n=1 Tax=unclassified Neochlamydia TaxID=2643326 RepID=UPI00140DE273|nr:MULTISPECIES: DNA repair protein RadA [unclassified Neochlamydia]MBS4166246.1 DNA repair protein RadA-like protein [Neochlamydia sp. AcF65]MBS4170146.1 DNA repair protein RadA-like protein [Neochlamydia sp. AcF95]NGY95114.1 putative DNA repair protein RadA [Neochlamydia sp. AcF84]
MAAKQKSAWYCSECGHKQYKWTGQCPQCTSWNSMHEEVEVVGAKTRFEAQQPIRTSRPVRLKEVSHKETPRIRTLLHEFDRLIGGGLVPGSLSLVGGDPGIGKSTLLLQISQALAMQGSIILYVCGEESVEQTSMRAQRLRIDSENLFLLSETNFSAIKAHIDQIKPDVLIIDSIQIVYKGEISSAPGSVSQVRETTTEFMHIAKGHQIATFLIGHVTKSGEIAGPRVLEHLVDTVLYFEGDKQNNYRMIRVVKNRFGPTDEIAVFQMQQAGLVEVPNPSQVFLEERRKEAIGSVIIPTIEGTRAILIETQALVTETFFSTPSRRCTGIDQNRLALLLAVLEKRMGYQLHRCDVFVSIAGGMRITEPGIDLGVLLSVASSMRNLQVDAETAVVGEVGLGGEIRSVTRIESRLKEAIHMGFQHCLIPKRNIKGIPPEISQKIGIIGVEFVEEAVQQLIR